MAFIVHAGTSSAFGNGDPMALEYDTAQELLNARFLKRWTTRDNFNGFVYRIMRNYKNGLYDIRLYATCNNTDIQYPAASAFSIKKAEMRLLGEEIP
jgi:hypothetical protein